MVDQSIIFPLRWESMGQQWWYAYPIEVAAANGYYEVVRELLHIDPNLLIKLTSLRRIQRLETVWDDGGEKFKDVAKCRAHVARNLLRDCDNNNNNNHNNTLIRAGYGGWILYTAASAGDVELVKEVLERDPVLVFGEGEFGATDLLYAAARSKSEQMFKLLFDFAVSLKSCGDDGDHQSGTFKWEMMNRALHALARAGNLELLKEHLLISLTMDHHHHHHVLNYRDGQGSTILHAAAAKGQLQVVKHLITAYPDTNTMKMVESTDHQGNTPLHIAAHRGFIHLVQAILPLVGDPSSKNNHGDTFLHMAISGSFVDLIKQLVTGEFAQIIHNLVNLQNNQGQTPLHLAVTAVTSSSSSSSASSMVHLLMTLPSLNLNVCDRDGLTPLDLLRQRNGTSSSSLVRKLVAAGAVSSSSSMLHADDWRVTRSSPLASHLRLQGQGQGQEQGYYYHHMIAANSNSPATSSDIFLDDQPSYYDDDSDGESTYYCSSPGEQLTRTSTRHHHSEYSPPNSSTSLWNQTKNVSAARRFKQLMPFTKSKNERIPSSVKSKEEEYGDDDDDDDKSSEQLLLMLLDKTPSPPPTSLRERFTTTTTGREQSRSKRLNKFSESKSEASSSTPLSPLSVLSSPGTSTTTPTWLGKDGKGGGSSSSNLSHQCLPSPHQLFGAGGRYDAAAAAAQRSKSLTSKTKRKLMNPYMCFRSQGLTVDETT